MVVSPFRTFPLLAAVIAATAIAAPSANAEADITDEEIAIMCDPAQTVVELTLDQEVAVDEACSAYEDAVVAAQEQADEARNQVQAVARKKAQACQNAPAKKPKVRARLCKQAANAERKAKRQEMIIGLQQLGEVDAAKQAFIDSLVSAGIFDEEI